MKNGDLADCIGKATVLCQILKGAIVDSQKSSFTLASLPPMFVNTWVKSVLKIFTGVTRTLVPSLFSRPAIQQPPTETLPTNKIFEQMVGNLGRFLLIDWLLMYILNAVYQFFEV